MPNLYATVAELKQQLHDQWTYTAATLSFDAGTKKITDTAYGLRRFEDSDLIQISGSANNDGYYTVATGSTAGEIVVSEALVDESAGASVTLARRNIQLHDDTLEDVLNDVSRWIDDYCRRRFYMAEETRYFTAFKDDVVYIDDLVSITSLATDPSGDGSFSRIWAATDYDLEPYNAAADEQPYTAIRRAYNGNYRFTVYPGVKRNVKVTGSFGYWSSVPGRVRRATLLQAARIYKRGDAPFGIVGSQGMGQLRTIDELDPDVMALLKRYRRIRL
jgi:hypothetical protein